MLHTACHYLRTAILVTTFLLIFHHHFTVSAQQSSPAPCTLKLEQLPEIRGFKLGMTLQDIQRRHPKFKAPEPDATGYSEMFYSVSYYLSYGEESLINEEDRKGINGIKVAFLDNKLVRIRVVYDDSVKWKDGTEFLQAMIQSLKLPKMSDWIQWNPFTMQLNCVGVTIQTKLVPDTRDGGSIAFGLNGVDKIISDRARANQEKKKQDFKP